MKLLVLAQTPPPLHGQSLMVQTLVEGLPALGIAVCHVPLQLSRDPADIGRWRPGKVATAVHAGLRARRLARRGHCDALYYVPAPGKRGALWRDLLVLALARPACPRLILHWHAVGLGEWLHTRATNAERTLARRFLGRADLAIVLDDALRADADLLAPRRVVVVPNGIADPCPDFRPRPRAGRPGEVLFLGLGSRTKGLADTVEAIGQLQARSPGTFRLTFSGEFATPKDREHFQEQTRTIGDALRHVGFADADRKRALFAAADVFCFPTVYPHEGQPLVLLEALAHDLPIITTRWRAIPSMLPPMHVWYVTAGRIDELAAALVGACEAPRPDGALRCHFLARFTREHHLAALHSALRSLAG